MDMWGSTLKTFILVLCSFREAHFEKERSSLKNKIFGFRDNHRRGLLWWLDFWWLCRTLW